MGGGRRLQFFSRNDLDSVLEALRENESDLEQGGYATVSDCSLPASQWGGPVDVEPHQRWTSRQKRRNSGPWSA